MTKYEKKRNSTTLQCYCNLSIFNNSCIKKKNEMEVLLNDNLFDISSMIFNVVIFINV